MATVGFKGLIALNVVKAMSKSVWWDWCDVYYCPYKTPVGV